MVQYTLNTREFLKVTWVGLWINVTLSALKIWAGIVGNSRAVLADGFHSLSDLVSDVALLIGVRFWSAPADDDHQVALAREFFRLLLPRPRCTTYCIKNSGFCTLFF